MGFEVDVINSVQFSNHTGYPFGWEGEVLDGSKLERLIDGLERNGLLDDFSNSAGSIGNILTGYIGSESFLTAVVNVVQKLKRLNPKCRYICDPVLGDMGKFYVPKELVDIYRRNVLPLADVITPNQFEIEQLTGITIRSIQDAQRACRSLHDSGVEIVLITSVVFLDNVDNSGDSLEVRGMDITNDIGYVSPLDSIGMFTSQRKFMQQRLHVKDEMESEDFIDEQWILYTPRLAGDFTGTGDVCAAIFLGLTSDGSQVGNTSKDRTLLACSLEKLAGTLILPILLKIIYRSSPA
jgi:pyridoxal/pyridoxine/pyridoxamine kinase